MTTWTPSRAAYLRPRTRSWPERVELEREDNEKIWALQRAGSYDHALAEANAAVARADALEYGPLLAETLYQRGVVYVRRGQYTEAEVDLERVYTLSIEHGYDALTLDSVTLLVLVVGQHLGRFEAGLQWGKTALALALGPNGEPLDEATVRHHVGRVLVEQGKLEEALVHSKQTLALYQEFGQTDTSKWTDLLVTMGHIMRHLGKTDEAQGHFQHALDISERALGPRHPDLVLPPQQPRHHHVPDEGARASPRVLSTRGGSHGGDLRFPSPQALGGAQQHRHRAEVSKGARRCHGVLSAGPRPSASRPRAPATRVKSTRWWESPGLR